jgi:hypothetical protein
MFQLSIHADHVKYTAYKLITVPCHSTEFTFTTKPLLQTDGTTDMKFVTIYHPIYTEVGSPWTQTRLQTAGLGLDSDGLGNMCSLKVD